MTNTEQQARELLAAEYERGGKEGSYPTYAALAREGRGEFTQCSIRAIKAALERAHNPDLEGLVGRLRQAAYAGDEDDLDDKLWSNSELTARDLLHAADILGRTITSPQEDDSALVERMARALAPNSWAAKDAGGDGFSLVHTIEKSLADAREALSTIQPPAIEDERPPTPETKHERDCAYVTNDGPAPCTCKAGRLQSPSPLNGDVVEALKAAETVIDYAASVLWTGRPQGVRDRPSVVDEALRVFRAALGRMVPASGDVVERVARAIYESYFADEWSGGKGIEAEMFRQCARAALSSLSSGEGSGDD